MKKQLVFIVSIILFSFSIVAAQTSTPVQPKMITSGGIVNGKAIKLVKPAYPPAARAVNAEGAVNVQVTIDEEGNVISATAVSGHPLLRAAAQEAALQSKFAPTKLSGEGVKVTGVVVYNFVADRPAGWFRIGYDLATIGRSPTLAYLNIDSIAKSFQPDWTAEKQQLDRLAEIKQADAANNPELTASTERKISEGTENRANGTVVRTITTERAIKPAGPLDPEQTSIAQTLISSLQSRLAGDETSIWQFNLGITINKALSEVRKPDDRQNTLASLRQHLQFVPGRISPEYISEVQKIITILEKQNLTEEDRGQISQILPVLFRN